MLQEVGPEDWEAHVSDEEGQRYRCPSASMETWVLPKVAMLEPLAASMPWPLGPGSFTLARGYRDLLAPVSTRNFSPLFLSEIKKTCAPREATTGGSLLTSFLPMSTATCSCVRHGQTYCGRSTSLVQPSSRESPLEAGEEEVVFGSSVASIWAGSVQRWPRLHHLAPRAAAALLRGWWPWPSVQRPSYRPPGGRQLASSAHPRMCPRNW